MDSTSVHITLDVRERQLIEEMTRLGISFNTAALDAGDILFTKESVSGTPTHSPLLVIERKSHADFAASNTDGRYREQRARLLSMKAAGVAVLYMLEGAFGGGGDGGGWMGSKAGHPSEETLKRLTTRLMLRYGVPVLFTESIPDTALWCSTLLAQLTEDPTVFVPDSAVAGAAVVAGFTAALNTAKKGNKTAGGTAYAMLSAVPGLGAKRIEALLATVTIADLVGMTKEEIAALSVGGKKLGPKLGETLFDALHSGGGGAT
jgi:ERCC4-type nuclease